MGVGAENPPERCGERRTINVSSVPRTAADNVDLTSKTPREPSSRWHTCCQAAPLTKNAHSDANVPSRCSPLLSSRHPYCCATRQRTRCAGTNAASVLWTQLLHADGRKFT